MCKALWLSFFILDVSFVLILKGLLKDGGNKYFSIRTTRVSAIHSGSASGVQNVTLKTIMWKSGLLWDDMQSVVWRSFIFGFV